MGQKRGGWRGEQEEKWISLNEGEDRNLVPLTSWSLEINLRRGFVYVKNVFFIRKLLNSFGIVDR